jgi:hypothetical protein
MLTIAHRVNTRAQLEQTPPEYGVEIDLRDFGDRLVLQHDPFSDGEDFSDWLAAYRHRFLILNIKSERIERRVLELVKQHGIEDYFLLDCSLPMIYALVAQGESRIAVRFSEWEPVEAALALAGKVRWVWVDCFTRLPFDDTSYAKLRAEFQLCVVSPELQGRDAAEIARFAEQLRRYPCDAVCTKRPDLWHAAWNEKQR